MISLLLWTIKQKRNNELTKQIKNKLIDSDNIMLVTRGDGGWKRANWIKESHICSNGRKLDLWL